MPGPQPVEPYDRVMRRSRKSKKRAHNGTPCIECNLTPSSVYPSIGVGSTADDSKVIVTAASVVWEHYNGRIPEGKVVCRDCDNKRCVNIKHLSLGTHKEKSKHMIKAGRQGKGAAKITRQVVQSIVKRLAAGEAPRDIASDTEASYATVCNIRAGRAWRGVTGYARASR